MTSRDADRIIEDAELDLITIPPLAVESRQRVAKLAGIRRDADKLGREIEAEKRSLERMICCCVFALSFIAFVLLTN